MFIYVNITDRHKYQLVSKIYIGTSQTILQGFKLKN